MTAAGFFNWSADVPVGMEGNIQRRLAGPPRKSVGDGAPTLPCENSAWRCVKWVQGFTGAFAPC
jgi:hypothetical protein